MRWNAQWSPPEQVDEGELQPSGQWRPAEAVRTRAWLSRHGRRSRDPRSQERAEVLPDGQLPARGTAGRCHPAPGPRHQALRSDPPRRAPAARACSVDRSQEEGGQPRAARPRHILSPPVTTGALCGQTGRQGGELHVGEHRADPGSD